jgi:hypothetical protein
LKEKKAGVGFGVVVVITGACVCIGIVAAPENWLTCPVKSQTGSLQHVSNFDVSR